ncbi:helix-turn-helix transcriptional regulator [Micromonospora sonneratiae]|uniref:Helix-turn-helix domain-containing protein n=1 Tax=Micromonospora sonneratiae TaxID=1184706 RepID=A0ABW3YTI6_9ACTN
MADGSSVPRRQLGRHLRQAREEAQISIEAAASELEWSRARMYRIEGGQVSIRSLDVKQMCSLYEVTDELRDVLVSLAKESKAKGWWHAYGAVIPSWFELYVGLEAAASAIRSYESALIPGLLQTREYAAAVFRSKFGNTDAVVEQKVALRLERQKLLTRRRPAAPTLDVIISEAVLRSPIGDRDGWLAQLAHLVNVRRKGLSVRVLPLSVGPHWALAGGAFVILEFPTANGRGEPTTVYSDGLTGGLYLDRPDEIAAYDRAWQVLDALALSPDESDDLIAMIIKEGVDA